MTWCIHGASPNLFSETADILSPTPRKKTKYKQDTRSGKFRKEQNGSRACIEENDPFISEWSGLEMKMTMPLWWGAATVGKVEGEEENFDYKNNMLIKQSHLYVKVWV